MAMASQEFEDIAEKFRTIGHPVRIAILNLLCNCDHPRLTVKSIYETLKLDQPSTSRHLNIMRKTGMLERFREGSDTFYSIYETDLNVACITKCFRK